MKTAVCRSPALHVTNNYPEMVSTLFGNVRLISGDLFLYTAKSLYQREAAFILLSMQADQLQPQPRPPDLTSFCCRLP
ncbi:hypothetical protein [Herbaspirillum camelliae]|uniref:hypothetical protein n=1 Tax=Herbaspirillum camelliae TaxID=1892903 RepID=UPI00117ABC09|nr:hypothetical protein [Herbaspirillum camelliae]